MSDADWHVVRAVLAHRGVPGALQFGRPSPAANVPGASELDALAAMPILIELLPALTNPRVVAVVADHLAQPGAPASAFPALRLAFQRWAPIDTGAGDALGNALCVTATAADLPHLVELARQHEFGPSRRRLVEGLSRFRRSPYTRPTLWELAADDDVAFQALQTLKRLAGAQTARERARQILRNQPGTRAAQAASRVHQTE